MEQKPIPGQEALVPPSPDIARLYLVEAAAITERRERAVDRRALAWLQIANAVITAAFLVVSTFAIREGEAGASQVVLFTFLVWGQLASGMVQRGGMQWRMARARWPLLLAGAIAGVAAIVLFGWVALDGRTPLSLALIPAALIVIAFGGYGVSQLISASGDPRRARPERVPLPRAPQWGTLLVGVALGVLSMLSAAPDDVTRSVVFLLVMMALLAWIVASKTDFGLPAVGASWRWPHIVAFAVSACVPVGLAVGGGPSSGHSFASIVGGVSVIVFFVAVSFVPGRGRRD